MRGTTHRIPGLVLTDHRFEVPLNHQKADGRTLSVYAREVIADGKEEEDQPWLLFLQGGPGFGSPRPMSLGGWLVPALKKYRVLLLDQRGTASSSPVNSQTLSHLRTPSQQAEYLQHFRADSIVADCEFIRRSLLGERKWSVLGQSFGGFCTCTYLSFAPDGLEGAFITGGIPPVGVEIDEIYRSTYAVLRNKNRLYFERYPEDAALVRRIATCLATQEVTLPEGDRLSVRKFRQLGMHFGMSDGFEIVHYLLEQAFVDGSRGAELSHAFLHGFEHSLSYNTNPIFSILHEAAYTEGCATHWSAERVRNELPEFNTGGDMPILFTGEMIYPWMFEEYGKLKPMAAAAQILAEKDDWPPLYDSQQLRDNQVPTVAAVYENDMYVARELSLQVDIGNLKTWVTAAHEHNGLRSQGEAVFGHLMEMARQPAPKG